jgi:hypothetical protein
VKISKQAVQMALKTLDRHVSAGFRFACRLEILHSVMVKRNEKMDSNLQLRHNFILCFTITYVTFTKIKGDGSLIRLYYCPQASSEKTLNEFGLNFILGYYRESSCMRFGFISVQYKSSYT